MNSFFASSELSAYAVRAAFISSGTVLNLFIGKKPACGARACTASGASSLSMFSRSSFESPSADVRPRSCSGSAPGFSSGDGGSCVQRNRRVDAAERVEEMPAQRVVQLAEDEVVRIVDADLLRALIEVAALQIRHDLRRPRRDLGIEQPRRPAAPVQRTPAETVREAFERRRRFPRHAPHLVARRLRLRRVFVEDHDVGRIEQAEDAGVLYVLRKRERTGVEDDRAKAAARLLLPEPDVLRDGRAKRAAADDHDVERSAGGRLAVVLQR